MECFGDLKDEVISAEELRDRETEIVSTKQKNPFLAMYNLWNQVSLDEKFHFESKIRTIKQRGRSIAELFYYTHSMWSQMTPRELMKSSPFRKFEEENYIIQFLLALRNEFEPLKRSLLSRSPVPTLAEVITELREEEARHRSSNAYIETKATEVEDDDIPLSAYLERRPIFRSMTTEEIHEAIDSGSGSGSGSTVCSVEELAVAASPSVDHCATSEGSHSGKDSTSSTIKILTYNVCIWDVELDARMKALCDLIQLHTPDIICFQEVTLESYNIFRQSSWWNEYESSILREEAEAGRLGSHFRAAEQTTSKIIQHLALQKLYNGKRAMPCRDTGLQGEIVDCSHLSSGESRTFRSMVHPGTCSSGKEGPEVLGVFSERGFSRRHELE